MARKVSTVKEAMKKGELKKALRIAKGFRIMVTPEQRSAMALAYECMVHPEFYESIGTDIAAAIAAGKTVIDELYGA